jgi:hypothetical protein
MSSETMKAGRYDDLVVSLTSNEEYRGTNPASGFRFMKRSDAVVRFSSLEDLDDPRAKIVELDLSVNSLNGCRGVSRSFYQALAWMMLASRVSLRRQKLLAFSYYKDKLEPLPVWDMDPYFDGIDPETLFVPKKGPLQFTPTWTAFKYPQGFEFMKSDVLARPIGLTLNGSHLTRCAEVVESLANELRDCVLRRGMHIVQGQHGPVDRKGPPIPRSSFIIERGDA